MPTGYTHPVAKGEVTDFPTFALRCARAFGALVEMRDAPHDAPIPEEFPPPKYAVEQLREARAELARLEDMGDEEAEAAALLEFREKVDRWNERRAEDARVRQRYEAMLAEVEAWEPPTPDHAELKKFMAEQLRESIRFDCPSEEEARRYSPRPERMEGDAWRSEKIAAAHRSVARAEESLREATDRARERTAWVTALRESLSSPEPTHA